MECNYPNSKQGEHTQLRCSIKVNRSEQTFWCHHFISHENIKAENQNNRQEMQIKLICLGN